MVRVVTGKPCSMRQERKTRRAAGFELLGLRPFGVVKTPFGLRWRSPSEDSRVLSCSTHLRADAVASGARHRRRSSDQEGGAETNEAGAASMRYLLARPAAGLLVVWNRRAHEWLLL